VEQTNKRIEHKIECSDADAEGYQDKHDDAGVVDNGFLAWPYNLFHFTFGVFEKACDPRGDTLEKAWFLFVSHCKQPAFRLLGFFVKCVFPAELAVFVHLKSVRIVFLVFLCVVITLFAFCAS